MKAEEPLKVLLEIVNKQANDATLWGVSASSRENRLQQALRNVHRQVRFAVAANPARTSSSLKGPSIFGPTG
jgi:hypothetical protein